jgi:hypothetical protein
MPNVERLKDFCDKCNLDYPMFEYCDTECLIVNKVFWYGKEVIDLSDRINRYPEHIAWILMKNYIIDYTFFLQLIIDDRKKYPNGKNYLYYKDKYFLSMKRKGQFLDAEVSGSSSSKKQKHISVDDSDISM